MFLSLRRQYFPNPSPAAMPWILMPKITEYLLGTVCIYILHVFLCFIHRKVRFVPLAPKNQFSPCWANVSKHLLLVVAVMRNRIRFCVFYVKYVNYIGGLYITFLIMKLFCFTVKHPSCHRNFYTASLQSKKNSDCTAQNLSHCTLTSVEDSAEIV